MNLNWLPEEVLSYIFDYLTACDLVNLSKTCIRLNYLINNLESVGNNLLISNQLSKSIKYRSKKCLDVETKLTVSCNWQCGKYKQTRVATTKEIFMPWMKITKNLLFISYGNEISVYKRVEARRNYLEKLITLQSDTAHFTDIVKFAISSIDDQFTIVSGHRRGYINSWKWNRKERENRSGLIRAVRDGFDVNAVDIRNDVVCSGARSGLINVYSLRDQKVIHYHDIDDHIWSINFNKSGRRFAVGSAKYNNEVPPLHVFDTYDRSFVTKFGKDFRGSSGLLDVRWFGDNDQILLSGGYDTVLRMWDLRMGDECVSKWVDPYDSGIYCIETDDKMSVVTGSQNHGKINLWDVRQTKCVQIYFVKCQSSPVYSITFDVCQLFAATDRNLSVFDFTSPYSMPKDYRRCIF